MTNDAIGDFKSRSLKYLKTTFIDNKYNLSAVIFLIVSIALGFTFYESAQSDSNFTYYLISVTAIYSTIQLTFLLQKISFLRGQKESLLTSSISLWKALTNYRYLCYLMEEHLRHMHYREYQNALKLDISINELFLLDMGMTDKIKKKHLQQLTKGQVDKKWPEYVLLVKMVDVVVNGAGSIFNLNTLNRIYAHNNKSVNIYLGMLTNEGIFDLYERVGNMHGENKSGTKTFIQQVCDKKQFLELRKLVESEPDDRVPVVLRRIDRYVVNQVLLPLHDNTFIIEKRLPNAFLLLLINAACILTFGSIIPLVNAFTVQSEALIRVCGGISVGMLLMSIVMICITFFHENDADLFKYSQIIYQGKNDRSY